jgi:hypothetical protein
VLTAGRVVGLLVLLKAVDVVVRGPQQLPPAGWLLVLAGWIAGALVLLIGRAERVGWAAVAAAGVGLAVDLPLDLRRQHLVLLVLVALAAAVALTERERLLLWRIQLSALYGIAALAKVNEAFLSGNVLALALPDLPLAALIGLSVVVIATEALLAVTPWVPRLRTPGLVLAALLHGGALLALSVDPLVGLRLVVFGGTVVLLHAVSAGLVPAQAGRDAPSRRSMTSGAIGSRPSANAHTSSSRSPASSDRNPASSA